MWRREHTVTDWGAFLGFLIAFIGAVVMGAIGILGTRKLDP